MNKEFPSELQQLCNLTDDLESGVELLELRLAALLSVADLAIAQTATED